MKPETIVSLGESARKSLPAGLWWKVRCIGTMLITPIRFSLRTAHWKSSLLARAVDASGNPMPWYTFPMVEFLKLRNFAGKRVLEFGGGQSTLWWAQHAETVVTIEGDKGWFDEIKTRMPANVTITHVPVNRETRDVSEIAAFLQSVGHQTYDVIVVDGHLREECAELSLAYLAPGGAMIMDNSEGYGFREFTQRHGLPRVDMYGFAAGGSRQTCTSIAWRDSCFLFDAANPLPQID